MKLPGMFRAGRSFLPLMLIAAVGGGCASAPQPAASEAAVERIGVGEGTFEFSGWDGPALRIHYLVPSGVSATTPIVLVMHGRGRNADGYHAAWAGLAETNGFILAVPEFDNVRFPGSETYNYGHFRDADGRVRPRKSWSFSAIEPLFDEIRARTGSRVATYAIYGHSAGAQFVHRFALFMPEARFHAAVSANAGSYAFPTLDVDFPFGLDESPVDEATLARALSKPMVVLLGTADTDPDHQSLPRQPQAMAQGPNRFERGQAFYAAARAKAAELGVPFLWELKYAEGVAHSNAKMAAFAAPFLGVVSSR